MARLLSVAALVVGLFVSKASAQSYNPASTDAAGSRSGGSRPVLRDRPQETFREIERGFYMGVAAGPSFILNPPASNDVRPFSPGQMAELELGFDIGPYVALSVFARASQQRETISYTGMATDKTVAGDFSTITPGASVRIKPIGLKDAQEVARTWFYVRIGAGYTLFNPTRLLPTPDILVFAGPGIEYYTRLRHFSIGVEAVGSMLATSRSFGFAITPNLRYAF